MTSKQSEVARRTHWLERVDAGSSQDKESKRHSEGNSLAEDGGCRD